MQAELEPGTGSGREALIGALWALLPAAYSFALVLALSYLP